MEKCFTSSSEHEIDVSADVITIKFETARHAYTVYLFNFIINPQVADAEHETTALPAREAVIIFNQPAQCVFELHFCPAEFLQVQFG